jgi:phenylacetate-CoA ligase
VTRLLPGSSALGLPFARMEGFLGRSDNMVKLRGINVFPQSLSNILANLPGFHGEYLCVLAQVSGREEMTVRIECHAPRDDELLQRYHAHLRQQLGVEVQVVLEAPRALAELTGVETRQKPLRLIKT